MHVLAELSFFSSVISFNSIFLKALYLYKIFEKIWLIKLKTIILTSSIFFWVSLTLKIIVLPQRNINSISLKG